MAWLSCLYLFVTLVYVTKTLQENPGWWINVVRMQVADAHPLQYLISVTGRRLATCYRTYGVQIDETFFFLIGIDLNFFVPP